MKSKKENYTSELVRGLIIDSLGLSRIAKKQQEGIVFMLMNSVSARINIMVWSMLSEEDKKGLEKRVKLGEGKFLDYVSSKVKYFPQLVENVARQTIEDFKQKRAKV